MEETPLVINHFTIPGHFAAGRTEFRFPPLEYTDTHGNTRHWEIKIQLRDPEGQHVPFEEAFLVPDQDHRIPRLEGYVGEITVETYVTSTKKGKGESTKGKAPTLVREGKNWQMRNGILTPKKNATNPATQAIRDALGRYNKQLKTGARTHVARTGAKANGAKADGADLTPTPAAAPEVPLRPLPMLIKFLDQTPGATLTPKDYERGLALQEKLDGIRLVGYREEDGNVVLYKRTGDPSAGQEHLKTEIAKFLADPPLLMYATSADTERPIEHPVPYIDGELFGRGKSRRWISGQGRRSDDEGGLEYHIFDVFFPGFASITDIPSLSRQHYLDLLFERAAKDPEKYGAPHLIRVANYPVPRNPADGRAFIEEKLKEFVAEGGEGVVIRKDWLPYVYSPRNYHSSNVLKLKPIHDDDFEIVGLEEGKGKMKGAAKFVLRVPNPLIEGDDTFGVVPKWPIAEKRKFYECAQRTDEDGVTFFDKYIRGATMTVEYDKLSDKTGKPEQPRAINIRTDTETPEVGERVREFYRICEIKTE